MSTSERVAVEMGQAAKPAPQRLVGYHIRYDRHTVGPNCKILFATDGILLREVTSDLLLRKYSVVILDEAHGTYYLESLNTAVYIT